eukprot:XP_001698301.1 COP-II coat subunit [Chlamydomonas reinhardtii]
MTVPPVAAEMQSPTQPAASASNGGAAVAAPGVVPCDHVLTLVAGCVVNQRAFANTCGVPLGAHMDFVPSAALRLPQITGRTPPRCNGCSGFMNTNLTKWVWKCNLCGAVNVHKDQLGHSADVASYAELCGEAVEYVQPLRNGAAGPAHTPQAVPPHVVFAVDTTLEPSDLRAVKEAVLASAASLPPATLISLITFDGAVALHNLGSAPARPGLVWAPAAAGCLWRRRARCLCAAVEASLRLVAAAAHLDLDLGRHHHLAASRAVGEKGRSPDNKAVAAALDLGVALGAMAAKIGVAVDIFTSTCIGINAPLLTAIAHTSGGELMPQVLPPHHLPTQHAAHNPSHGGASHSHSSHGGHGHGHGHSHPTGVSAAPVGATAGGFVPGLLSRQLRAALGRRWGVEGRLDCYCSEGLKLTQWMGPLDPIRVGRGASLRLEVTRDLDVPSLLLQVALHYTDLEAQQRVVRVVTRKIQVVESRSEFLRTVNPTAAAALLGKRAVLDAKKAGAFRDSRKAEEARLAVGAQLSLVAARCGREAAGAATEGGAASSSGLSPSPGRFPMPSVVLTPGAQAGGGQLAARLIPVHRDPMAGKSAGILAIAKATATLPPPLVAHHHLSRMHHQSGHPLFGATTYSTGWDLVRLFGETLRYGIHLHQMLSGATNAPALTFGTATTKSFLRGTCIEEF